MLKITDRKFLFETTADAVSQAHLNCKNRRLRNRWINAIAKAAATLDGDTTFLHWDFDHKILFYWSPESNEIYRTTEECECPAYRQPVPLPCYHRARHRILKNYFDWQLKPDGAPKIDFSDAVFFDPDLSARQKVDLLNCCINEGRIELKPRVEALLKLV